MKDGQIFVGTTKDANQIVECKTEWHFSNEPLSRL
jgi:hypothetical protein